MSIFSLLEKDAGNGTRALLQEIRKHQVDMPVEVQNDMTFGALVVLYDMGVNRGKRLKILERWSITYGGMLIFITLTIIALHADVPWLSGLLDTLLAR